MHKCLTTAFKVKADNSEISNEFVISRVNFELRVILGIWFFFFLTFTPRQFSSAASNVFRFNHEANVKVDVAFKAPSILKVH